ncbi:MAG: glycosyltransferase family 9 protein, partial [Hyphomonadaceae bacterium]
GAIAPGATPPAAQAPLPAAYAAAARAALPDGPVYIGLAPGAGNKARGNCWPLERFIALAEAQTEAGRAPVMILGPDEAEWLPALRARLPGALFGWPDLTERYAAGLEALPFCTALGARMTAAVTNCAGPGHLLAAGGAAMVCLYGPTNPEKFFPYAARGRWLRAADFGGDRVMEAIPLEAVRAALEAEIAQGRPPPGAPGA